MATEIDTLLLKLDADITAMSAKLDQAVAKNKKAASDIQGTWSGGQGSGFKALEDAFDSITNKITSVTREIPGLGAALEALGPAGLAAAAGVAALLGAFEATKQAIEFGDSIARTAEKLGITAEALQEYRFAVVQTGGTVADADASILKFTETLGKAELGSTKAAKAFNALHLDPKTLVGDPEALEKTINALAGVTDQAQRLALAEVTGAGAFVTVANQGVDAMESYKQAAVEAGAVMTDEVAEKARVAAVQLETIASIVKTQLETAFINLAPEIITVAEYLAATSLTVLDLGKAFVTAGISINKEIESWGDTLNRWSAQLDNVFPGLKIIEDSLNNTNRNVQILGARAGGAADASSLGKNNPLTSVVADFVANFNSIKAIADRPVPKGVTGGGPPPGSLGRTPHAKTATDVTATENAAVQQALDSATKDALTAMEALAATIQERADDQRAVLAAEHAAKIDALVKKEADLASKKNDANTEGQIKTLEAAKTEENIAYAAKQELLLRQETVELLQAQLADLHAASLARSTALTVESDHYTAQAGLADTAQQRVALEQKALAARQAAENEQARDVSTQAAGKLAGAEATGTDVQYKAALAEWNAATQAQADLLIKHAGELKAATKAAETPVQQYADSLKDLTSFMQNEGVTAAKDLADGLADALVNAKSFGDTVSSVFKKLLQDIISEMLQKNLTSPIVSALSSVLSPGSLAVPAHQIGTSFTAGGPTLVGENGPELINLPRGAQVIPNGALRNLGMGSPSAQGVTVMFDNRGAVIWEQAARQMMAYADRAAATAGLSAAQYSRSVAGSDLSRMASRQLG